MPAVNAMRTADWVFATTDTRAELLAAAANALAIYPGQMCLVSLVDGETLRPVGAAHVLASRAAQLQTILDESFDAGCADAFSRAARQRCGPLRMRIGNPSLYDLWLPEAYRDYALRTRVSWVLAAPLAIHGKVLGTFLLWREGDDARPYTAADQAYVAGLTARLALALRAYAGPAPYVQAGGG